MVGTVTGLWAGGPKNRGSITGVGNRFFFSFPQSVHNGLGPQSLGSG